MKLQTVTGTWPWVRTSGPLCCRFTTKLSQTPILSDADLTTKAALLDGGASTREVRRLNSLLRDAVTSVEDPTSGSGSGLPLLVQRTVARQIELRKKVGMVWVL